MEQMEKQAAHVGTKLVTDLVTKLELAQRPFRLTCDSGDVYLAETVILATGAQARWLGTPSEEKFKGFGVSACATCDGFFYRGKEGRRGRRRQHRGRGSDVSHQLRIASDLRASPRPFPRRTHPAGTPVQESQDQGGLGQRHRRNPRHENPSKVTHVRLKNVKTGAVSELPADGVFIAIGHAPSTELVVGQVKLKPSGYIEVAPNSTATSVPGVFAAGDVADEIYRQAVTAAGLGCMAALEAERFLALRASDRARRSDHGTNPRRIYRYGLGQAEGVSRSGGSGQLHPCRRTARAVAIGGLRQVSALEQELSVSLFHRHARGLILTEQGDLLFRTAHDVFMQLQAARAKLTDSRERPSGDLKITTPPALGINWLIPRLHEFTGSYPEIRISMIVTDEDLDLSMREADVAIRTRKPTQPDLIQRKLFSIGFHAYCSPEYIKRFGTPRTLDDLDAHRIIMLSDSQVPAHLRTAAG
jgi:thioredoxin reductase (NADPH)